MMARGGELTVPAAGSPANPVGIASRRRLGPWYSVCNLWAGLRCLLSQSPHRMQGLQLGRRSRRLCRRRPRPGNFLRSAPVIQKSATALLLLGPTTNVRPQQKKLQSWKKVKSSFIYIHTRYWCILDRHIVVDFEQLN